MRFITILSTVALLLSVYSCNDNSTAGNEQSPPPIPVINYAVVKTFPHDTTSFTEGFLVHYGQLLESTGSPSDLPQTRSLVGFVDTTTGKMNVKIELDSRKYFGEGIVIVKDKLYLLTYKNQTCFVYNATSFNPIGQFRFSNKEGWGLTTNGTEIIMSDGTDQLTFINPDNFTPIRKVRVTENGVSRNYINELEFINGFIYANIWQQDMIVKIDPATGNIAGRLDISTLGNEARGRQPDADASNGIAWDSATDKIYITGKLWPTIYEVKFSH
ncbi:MAG: glutaminyl-peptide cyclotransferase [Niastella sp.]|nr:glutaminyl-peptide cyclotransferase [Niastella sp.]